jgi:hypothetical protein
MHLIDSIAQRGVVLSKCSIRCGRDLGRSNGIPSTILGMASPQKQAEVNLIPSGSAVVTGKPIGDHGERELIAALVYHFRAVDRRMPVPSRVHQRIGCRSGARRSHLPSNEEPSELHDILHPDENLPRCPYWPVLHAPLSDGITVCNSADLGRRPGALGREIKACWLATF